MAIDCGTDVNIIRQLVESCGCDPKSADAAGDTALHYAVNMELKEVAKYLIKVVGPEYKEIENEDGEKPYD